MNKSIMKKTFILLLAISFGLMMFSCGGTTQNTTLNSTSSSTTTNQTTSGSTTSVNQTTEGTTTNQQTTTEQTTTTEQNTTTTEYQTITIPEQNYQVDNGSFETGNLSGWTIVSGNAFSDMGVTNETDINETTAYNKDGNYLYGMYDEAQTGQLRSSNFVIAGTGYISFKLGAGYNPGLTYISIVNAITNVELYRFANSDFNKEDYDSYQTTNNQAKLNGYIADLSDSVGLEVYILIVDQSTQNYGYVTFDHFVTFYQNIALVPDYTLAEDIKPVFQNSSSTPNELPNGDFGSGTLEDWTVIGESDSFLDSHINSNHRLSNRPNESSVGVLRSSAFKVGGEDLLSFRLGATKHPELTYMSVKVVGTNQEVFRTYSDRWKEADEENTHLYYIDLSNYHGQRLYLEFVDNSRGDWGLLSIEDIQTYYETLPTVLDEIAVNLLDPILSNPDFTEMRSYVDNLMTGITDETERLTFQKTFYATIDGISNIKGTWPSVVHYNRNATTFIYTGDIPAMWLRDSSAQVLQYLQFMNMDQDVKLMIKGLLKQQFEFIRRDPYANAFNQDGSVFERKFEIDSLCYPIWLAYEYYNITNDDSIFDTFFIMTVQTILDTLEAEQHHSDDNYRISNDYDRSIGSQDVNLDSGLIWTGYRPSDDVAYYKYNIPENMFAVATLERISELFTTLNLDDSIQEQAASMAQVVRTAIATYGTYNDPTHGTIYVYETTGNNADPNSSTEKLLMDAANIPSLLSAPWLGFCEEDDPTYLNTRSFILSTDNPYYYEGTYASGIGDPHDMVGSTDNPHPDVPVPWHMAIAMQAITSTSQDEVTTCINYMTNTTAGTYVMHEAFNANDPSDYSRDFFTWPCSLYAYVYLTKVLDVNLNQ